LANIYVHGAASGLANHWGCEEFVSHVKSAEVVHESLWLNATQVCELALQYGSVGEGIWLLSGSC